MFWQKILLVAATITIVLTKNYENSMTYSFFISPAKRATSELIHMVFVIQRDKETTAWNKKILLRIRTSRTYAFIYLITIYYILVLILC